MRFNRSLAKASSGQALLETALMMPILLLLVLNAVNFGYFFLVVTNLTAASRTSVLYSVEGDATPYASSLPSSGGSAPTTTPGSVTYTVFQDLTGALWNPTGASVAVCTIVNTSSGTGTNGSGASLKTNCQTCTNSGCSATSTTNSNPADPEAPTFVANTVTISYQFQTLIPGKPFNIPMWASPMCNGGTCTFVRTATMREMN